LRVSEQQQLKVRRDAVVLIAQREQHARRSSLTFKRLEALPTATRCNALSENLSAEEHFRTNPCLRHGRPLKSFKAPGRLAPLDAVESGSRRLRRLGQARHPPQTTTHIPQSKPSRPRNVASSRRQDTRSLQLSGIRRAISRAVSPSVGSRCQILFTSFGEERLRAQ
jgi:hypothetical protein